MITTVLCYSATSGSSVADCGKPCRLDMGNVGLWPSAGAAMRGMARGYAAGNSRGPGWHEFAGKLGQLQAGSQAGSGMARSRAMARVNWVSQGQCWGRCRVSPNPPMRSGLGVGTRGEGFLTRRSALDSDKWGRWRPLVVVGGADGGPGQRRWGWVGGTACRGRQSRTGPVRLCGSVG